MEEKLLGSVMSGVSMHMVSLEGTMVHMASLEGIMMAGHK